MNRPFKPFAVGMMGVVCAFAVHASTNSSGGPYRLERSVIAGGGSTINSGTFRLSGTLGQSASATLSASSYRLYGGFWPPDANAPTDRVFANGFDS